MQILLGKTPVVSEDFFWWKTNWINPKRIYCIIGTVDSLMQVSKNLIVQYYSTL